MTSSDPLLALTGDHAGAALLRQSLTQLAEQHDGTPLAVSVREVLAGRLDVRELALDPEFAAFTGRGMESFTEAWEGLSPEERAEQLRAGEAYLAALDKAD